MTRARAKINLWLKVVGKRADGYHLLDSLVAFADLADTLDAAPADTLSLAVDGPQSGSLAAEPDNLVLKAARALAARTGVAPRAALRLTKNIPVAAGLGGGSADAAADRTNYAAFPLRKLGAEVMLDALNTATGTSVAPEPSTIASSGVMEVSVTPARRVLTTSVAGVTLPSTSLAGTKSKRGWPSTWIVAGSAPARSQNSRCRSEHTLMASATGGAQRRSAAGSVRIVSSVSVVSFITTTNGTPCAWQTGGASQIGRAHV